MAIGQDFAAGLEEWRDFSKRRKEVEGFMKKGNLTRARDPELLAAEDRPFFL